MTRQTSYILTRRGARDLRDFFEANPSEELTLDDAQAKTGLCESTLRNYIGALVADGTLERISVYRLKAKAA